MRRFLAATAVIGASLLAAVPLRADLGAAMTSSDEDVSGKERISDL